MQQIVLGACAKLARALARQRALITVGRAILMKRTNPCTLDPEHRTVRLRGNTITEGDSTGIMFVALLLVYEICAETVLWVVIGCQVLNAPAGPRPRCPHHPSIRVHQYSHYRSINTRPASQYITFYGALPRIPHEHSRVRMKTSSP